jgi:hypothetical protein
MGFRGKFKVGSLDDCIDGTGLLALFILSTTIDRWSGELGTGLVSKDEDVKTQERETQAVQLTNPQ